MGDAVKSCRSESVARFAGGVLQPVTSASGGWRLGVIENHYARPLTLCEIEQVIGIVAGAQAKARDDIKAKLERPVPQATSITVGMSRQTEREVAAAVRSALDGLAAGGRVVVIDSLTINVAGGGGAMAGGDAEMLGRLSEGPPAGVGSGNILHVHGPVECLFACSTCEGRHHWLKAAVAENEGRKYQLSVGDPLLVCAHCKAWAEYPDWWGDDEDAVFKSISVGQDADGNGERQRSTEA